MTKREETIERLTKGMSPRDKEQIIAFWSGKGSLNGAFFKKYQSKIAEFDRIMNTDNTLEEFLRDTRTQYKTPFNFEQGQQLP